MLNMPMSARTSSTGIPTFISITWSRSLSYASIMTQICSDRTSAGALGLSLLTADESSRVRRSMAICRLSTSGRGVAAGGGAGPWGDEGGA